MVAAGQELSSRAFPYASVDEALHAFSDNPLVVQIGKLAIGSQILGGEARSSLYDQKREGTARFAKIGGWLSRFFSLGLNGVPRSRIPDAFSTVTIINFNYDRAIEHFIYNSVVALGLPREHAVRTVSNINMIRPYGSLGPLNWQAKDGVEFGVYGKNLRRISDNLRTFTETLNDDIKATIATRLDQSAVVIYLGFGFHKQNVQIMQSQAASFNAQTVFATAFDVDGSNYPYLKRAIKLSLRKYDDSGIDITPWKSTELFDKAGPAISFAVSQ
jgi:hypothetical protein